MEMAMARNFTYIDKFQHDIQTQRFSILVNEPLNLSKKSSKIKFGEEHNAWLGRISRKIFCYYKSENKFNLGVNIELLIPRMNKNFCETRTKNK